MIVRFIFKKGIFFIPFFMLFLISFSCAPQDKTDKNSFEQFLKDKQLFEKGYQLFNSQEYEKSITFFDSVRGIDRRGIAWAYSSEAYLFLGDSLNARRCFMESMTVGGYFPVPGDTLFASSKELIQYSRKRDTVFLELAKQIRSSDQLYRSSHLYRVPEFRKKQDSIDNYNLTLFEEYLAEYGWPCFKKTGDDLKVRGYTAFLHHLPHHKMLQFLDSSLYYSRQGDESWRIPSIFASKLIVDRSVYFKMPVQSFYANNNGVIDDMELFEIGSIIGYGLETNKDILLDILYTDNESEKTSDLILQRMVDLCPDCSDQISVKALSLEELVNNENPFLPHKGSVYYFLRFK